MKANSMTNPSVDLHIDASSLQCPMPLLKTRQALRHLKAGQLLEVIATDAASADDIPAYLRQSCHELVRMQENQGRYAFLIRRGEQET
ncbi:MAG: sulfurtransferase TusA family protein [Pseudomonadales bacterium]|nr:sulfurtransferase TusA family protein [Pseudomonadales bacterium]